MAYLMMQLGHLTHLLSTEVAFFVSCVEDLMIKT